MAQQARHLTVFQRTANYTVPAHNKPLDPAYVAEVKAHYPEMRKRAKSKPAGIDFVINMASAIETPSTFVCARATLTRARGAAVREPTRPARAAA